MYILIPVHVFIQVYAKLGCTKHQFEFFKTTWYFLNLFIKFKPKSGEKILIWRKVYYAGAFLFEG